MRDVYVAAAAVVRYSLAGYIQSVVHCSLAARRKELKEGVKQPQTKALRFIRVNKDHKGGDLNLGSRVLPRRVVSCKTFLRRLWTNLDETLMTFDLGLWCGQKSIEFQPNWSTHTDGRENVCTTPLLKGEYRNLNLRDRPYE